MALDFPANPTDGQVYGSYIYSATSGVWKAREESAAPAVVSPITPINANPGDIWVDSSDGISYVRYDDGTSSQWIELISSGVTSLALKADKTYVDSQDALKANLASPTFTGNVVLPSTTYIPGSVVQVQEYRSAAGDKTASSGAYVNIMSVSFTTKFTNSKLFMTYYSGQMNPGSPQSNAMFDFQIDGASIADFATNHIFYSDAGNFTIRPTVTIPIMTGSLTKGSHTILIRGGAYNSSYTYDFQSSGSPERRGRLIVMEVAQ